MFPVAQHLHELVVFYSPFRRFDKLRGALGEEALDDDVAGHRVDYVKTKPDIFLERVGMDFDFPVSPPAAERRARENLELVHLESLDRETACLPYVVQYLPAVFSRESGYEMQPAVQPFGMGAADGILHVMPCMPAVDGRKRGIERRLGPDLEEYGFCRVDVGKHVYDGVGEDVGTRAYGYPDHIIALESVEIELTEGFDRPAIGVGVRLEIREIFHLGIFAGEESLSLRYLHLDAVGLHAIGRREGIVAAIGAAAGPDGAVAVRTRKPSVDRDLLDLHAGKK